MQAIPSSASFALNHVGLIKVPDYTARGQVADDVQPRVVGAFSEKVRNQALLDKAQAHFAEV